MRSDPWPLDGGGGTTGGPRARNGHPETVPPAPVLPGPPWVEGGAGWAEPLGRGTTSSQSLHFRLGSARPSKLPLTQVGAVEGMVSETLSPGQAGGFLL